MRFTEYVKTGIASFGGFGILAVTGFSAYLNKSITLTLEESGNLILFFTVLFTILVVGYFFYVNNPSIFQAPKRAKKQKNNYKIETTDTQFPFGEGTTFPINSNGWQKYDDEPTIELIRNLNDPANSPFIKDGAIPEKVMLGSKEVNLYQLRDINWMLDTNPSTIITGSSGGGKSFSARNIIQMLNEQYPGIKFLVWDGGASDFSSAAGTTYDEYKEIIDALFIIMKGRQKEPKDIAKPRIGVILEEYEAATSVINTLKKADKDKIVAKFGDIVRMGRKININFIVIGQSLKAQDIDTNIRNNLSNQIVHRSPKNLATMYSVPFDISTLPSGLAYYNNIDGLVEFPPMPNEPPMQYLSMNELERLAKYYKTHYPELEEVVT